MDIPKSLTDKLKHNKIVIFAGAGVSFNSGLPNWKELVRSILLKFDEQKEPKKQPYIDAIESDVLTPLEVLTKIEAHRTETIENLESIIRSYDHVKPSSVHGKLGQISNHIITTNYDCLFESALEDFEKISYSNDFKIAKLKTYKKYIFKIHGDIHEPDKCIFFPHQYDSLYTNPESSSVFELKKIISDKSMLFIGFSMTDPYISNIFNFISDIYKGFNPEHYIITTDKHASWPAKIVPIHIDSHSDIDALLDKLKEHKETATEPQIKQILEDDAVSILDITEDTEYELPPQCKFWVGRNQELLNISNENFKVVFITGIGGQGKSALAAHYLQNYVDPNTYELVDWRDFKEETNRFQTKLISIIKRISSGRITAKQVDSASNQDLVDILFKELKGRRMVFVFDNIDSYIDLEQFKPTGGMAYFFDQALSLDHKSKFIFTCRPFIREASVNFYQLKLSGISEQECKDLFSAFKISIKAPQLAELSKKAYDLTKGHPLWLNLIAAQALRGLSTVNTFIKNISDKTDFNEDDFSSILSGKILDNVWLSLNEKQKTLLRAVSETVKPETISDLRKILESELNPNQFSRAFKVLQNLHLLELKPSHLSENQVELHPLVKEFILSKFPQKERSKYITLFVNYYDNFIYILKPKLSSDLTLADFQNWTSKIELQINNSDFKPALVALQEVSESILSAGFIEEYIRVGEKLFSKIDWKKAIENEYSYFHSQFSSLIEVLIQFGKFDEVSEMLDTYSQLIPGKSSYYLLYCSSKCYQLWYQKNYQAAIEIGEEGDFLIKESGIPDTYSLRHNLALARRDSKDLDNLRLALKFFLRNETIESALALNKELGGHYYGNIGKCLEFQGNLKDSIICYYFSLSILFEEDNSHTKLNIGYASSWIYSLLLKSGDTFVALHFLKLSIISWNHSSPPRAESMKKEWKALRFDKESKNAVDKLPEWKVLNFCKEQIKQHLK